MQLKNPKWGFLTARLCYTEQEDILFAADRGEKMLRHIITWNYGDGFTVEQNKENALKIKEGFEALNNTIDGLIEIKIYINELPTSSKDLILTSLFESTEALADYKADPNHKKVSAFVKTVLKNRACIDYYE